ncbi:hypothetical protein KXV68_002213 [Aspergillus fumigatus]|nr:hypothetical protein CNMCM8714_003495 [Aspergillus fumigatus]KAF4266040.1 hypothetical protein CNMCM8812_002892 [Aspergillus fumigatus]KAF4279798.1 hypothetical protein CNMCM8689_003070 [Aspergillus fumigatus]KAF4289886.1 hypothetical protein CNMCM8686_001915 [Aspergillus fumigatus]KAH1305814.1 hypothetical protein KXX66_002585 [Aspergillus fumigatus]
MQLTVLDRLTMRIRLSEGPMSLHLIPQSNSIDSRCMFEVAADMLFTMIRESAALSTTPPAHALADCWILQPARNVPVATWVQEVDRCVKFCTGLPPPTGIGAQPRNSRAKDVSIEVVVNVVGSTGTLGAGKPESFLYVGDIYAVGCSARRLQYGSRSPCLQSAAVYRGSHRATWADHRDISQPPRQAVPLGRRRTDLV